MAARDRKSKKRSDTKSSPAKRLEATTFFVDRSLGDNVVPDALRAVGLKIERHVDHFVHDAPDTEWLERCGAEGWVVLAKDRAIRSNPLERLALFRAKVAAFFLTSAGAKGAENAQSIIKGLHKLANLLEKQRRPFIARITKAGDVELWLDAKGNDRLRRR